MTTQSQPCAPVPASAPAPAFTPASSDIAWSNPQRQDAFDRWLAGVAGPHGLRKETLRSASSDASFRRYFRIDGEQASFIVMDAPPPLEDVRPFVHVAQLIAQAGLNAPQVLAQEPEQGFLLLSDLGSQLYLQALEDARTRHDDAALSALMRSATTSLVTWQGQVDARTLPPYDDALLRRELALFPDWCVTREYGHVWTAEQHAQWQTTCDLLVRSALAQPTVAVHRDYMPRNLMVTPNGPGILDFQDAVRGPITYDAASLIRDAFFSWDEEVELDIGIRYWQAARKAGLPVGDDFGDFWRQLEWMGLQRHLKVLGIFCRLKHRDGKPRYSEDLPRFFHYAYKVATRYQGLGPLAHLLEPLMGAQRVEAFY